MALVYVVLCLALIFYFVTVGAVGRLRHRHNIVAPACVGNLEFERAFRVQQNTLEQLVPFLPALYLFGLLISPLWASLLGAVWIGGRLLYMQGYMKDAARRGPGAIITMLTTVVLTLGVLIEAVIELAGIHP
jgi:glutathione S-transferase